MIPARTNLPSGALPALLGRERVQEPDRGPRVAPVDRDRVRLPRLAGPQVLPADGLPRAVRSLCPQQVAAAAPDSRLTGGGAGDGERVEALPRHVRQTLPALDERPSPVRVLPLQQRPS